MLREIAEQEFFTETIHFSVKRGQDLNAAAKFLLFEFSGKLRETKKTTLDRFIKTATKMTRDQRIHLELAGRNVLDVIRDMGSVFLPKDQLLSSAGLLPVYYWLIRDLNEEQQSEFRGFLVEFEEDRRQNRQLLRDQPDSPRIKSELVEHDNYNRSTNDQISHDGRHRILLERFQKYTSK